MSKVNVYSINVKGLNSPRKRRLLFRELRRKSVEIAFLQETRIPKLAAFRLSDPAYSRTYVSCSTPKRNGVAILLRNSCPMVVEEVHTDGMGRCLIVRGTISSQPYSLIALYGPNCSDASFWDDTRDFINSHARGRIIMGGYFNATLCPPVDRSDPRRDRLTQPPSSQDSQYHSFVQELGLIDIWRIQHPSTRDYTFYSQVHDSYSRIDCFLISPDCIPSVVSSDIGSITWSDHADVSLKLIPFAPSPGRRWRLDPFLLNKPGVADTIKETTSEYFQLNDTPDISPQILWAAYKPVIRGKLLSLAAYHKKLKLADITSLQTLLRQYELQHKSSPSSDTFTALSKVRSDLNLLFVEDAGRAMLWSKQRYYDRSNKMDSPMARLINPRSQYSPITVIRDRDGPSHKT
uniref:exodeoxyribonuclease III n=1 Tax=Leptobrachium leishanense TaxID=445787 RepID=A0A8C5MXA6_9ANUR